MIRRSRDVFVRRAAEGDLEELPVVPSDKSFKDSSTSPASSSVSSKAPAEDSLGELEDLPTKPAVLSSTHASVTTPITDTQVSPAGSATGTFGVRKTTRGTWVLELQQKLLDYANANALKINLGSTGVKRNGVDGSYGTLTRGAVKIVARHMGISDPLVPGMLGPPIEDVFKRLGLAVPPIVEAERRKAVSGSTAAATPSPASPAAQTPPTPGSPATPAAQQQPESEGQLDFLSEVSIDGGTLNLVVWSNSRPAWPELTNSLGRNAVIGIYTIRSLVTGLQRASDGSIKIKSRFPDNISYIRDENTADEYMRQVNTTCDELSSYFDKISKAIKEAVNAKHAELGHDPRSRPSVRGGSKAYSNEVTMLNTIAETFESLLGIAQRNIEIYVQNKKADYADPASSSDPYAHADSSPEEPKELIELLAGSNTKIKELDPADQKEFARRIGSDIIGLRYDLAKHILSKDNSQYKPLNVNDAYLKNMMAQYISARKDSVEALMRKFKSKSK